MAQHLWSLREEEMGGGSSRAWREKDKEIFLRVLFSWLTDLPQWSDCENGLVGSVLSPQVSDCC